MRRITRVTLAVAACSVGVAVAAQASNGDKVFICHGTASDKNPYVLIRVDSSALAGHFDGTAPGHGKNNHPDVMADADGHCPSGPGGEF